MEQIVKSVLTSMSSVKKPQRQFMLSLLMVLAVFQGKATFLNLSRYSDMSEKRIRRWSHRDFNFSEFNLQLITRYLPENNERIAAIDASFLNKSGKKTEGLGYFYNGSQGRNQKGLEVSTISIHDLKSNTAYALDSRQTLDIDGKTRVDLYAHQVADLSDAIKSLGVKYLAADSYYSKVKFVSTVLALGLHLVGKLRIDADLRWLYRGEYQGIGRPKKFDGKVVLDTDQNRFEYVGNLEKQVHVHTAIVWSKNLNCNIRVVMLSWNKAGKTGRALLFSTDTKLNPMKIVEYYRSRFQIEFLFRDAKQYTGLTGCQSPRSNAINMQVNASLSALNILKIEDRENKETENPTVISIASWKRRKFNQHLMKRLFEALGLELNCKKVRAVYEAYSQYGEIAS